jgi:hypothetical protein
MAKVFDLIDRRLSHLRRLPCAQDFDDRWSCGYQAALRDVTQALQDAQDVVSVLQGKDK